MEAILKQILDHRFFEGFPAHLFEGIALCAQSVSFDADEPIYNESDDAEEFFLIQNGRVALELHAGHRGTLIIQTTAQGEVLGWSWIFAPYPRRYDARAVTPVTAIALQGECLRRQCDKEHHLGHELYRRFALAMLASLHATRMQLMDLYSRHQPLSGSSERRS